MQLLLGCFGSVPPKALDGSFDVGHFMSDFILDVGHVICCCSAVSAADRQRLWKLIQLLIHSVGNVSALFVESCCYSAVVRVGGFLETSSRSVLFSSCDCAGYRLALRYTGFGPSLAAKVLATRNVLWIPKVTGSIFSGLCFWLA